MFHKQYSVWVCFVWLNKLHTIQSTELRRLIVKIQILYIIWVSRPNLIYSLCRFVLHSFPTAAVVHCNQRILMTSGYWSIVVDFYLRASSHHYCRVCLALIHLERRKEKEGSLSLNELTCTCTMLPPVETLLCMLCLHHDYMDWCCVVSGFYEALVAGLNASTTLQCI